MNTTIMFVVASLIMVTAMVVIAVPIHVQADRSLWCYESSTVGSVCPKDTHGDCNKAQKIDPNAISKCEKAF
jgi:hypothetical protein